MSNSHIFMSSGFPRAPLRNGLGRYLCQLKRVTIKFCKSHGDSRGVREFIESELVDFARSHPSIVVYLKPRRHRSPCLFAEYLNGSVEYINCHNFSREEVFKWLNLLTLRSGRDISRYRKLWHTDNPSIQGVWSPFTHRDPRMNTLKFPMDKYYGPVNLDPSATEKLIELFKQQSLNEKPQTS